MLFDITILGECEHTNQALSKNGYGHSYFYWKQMSSSRLTWCLARNIHPQEIEGLIVRHICGNKRCVNINHLEIGTHQDNMQDRDTHNRTAKEEKHGMAKLTKEQVLEIRARAIEDQCMLAKEFGIGQPHVSSIIRRKVWKNI